MVFPSTMPEIPERAAVPNHDQVDLQVVDGFQDRLVRRSVDDVDLHSVASPTVRNRTSCTNPHEPSAAVEDLLGFPLDSATTHVYLCGSPAMIGLPRRTPGGEDHFPEPTGMVEVLVRLGFRLDEPRRPGNIHFEKFW